MSRGNALCRRGLRRLAEAGGAGRAPGGAGREVPSGAGAGTKRRRVGGLKPAGRRSPGAANKDLCSAGLRPRVFQPSTGHGGQPGSSEKEPDKRVHI